MTTTMERYLGEVGEKITDIPVTIRYAKYNYGSWNRSASMFIIAEADSGQTIKISGSSQSLFGLQRGDHVTIASAKVKDHGEYQGTPQTILFHVKIEQPEAPDPDDEFLDELPIEPQPKEDPLATTTLAKFAGAKRRNYESLPTIDVEILPDIHHCRECGAEVTYDPRGGEYRLGKWSHKDPATAEHGHISSKIRCRYCHAEDPVAVYRQHPWHDAVECSRCGGHDGYAIGD